MQQALEAQPSNQAAQHASGRPADSTAATVSQPDAPSGRRSLASGGDNEQRVELAEPAGLDTPPPWWVANAGSSTELRELLAAPNRGEMVTALADQPHVLALFAIRPDIIEQVTDDPARLLGYLLDESRHSDGALPNFESVFNDFLWRNDLTLSQVELDAVRDQAQLTWSHVQDQWHAAQATRLQQRHDRFEGLKPADNRTWEMSGTLIYGDDVNQRRSRLSEKSCSKNSPKTPPGCAKRRDIALHKALHTHLDGGDQGVSVAFLLNPEGQVDTFISAVSQGRSGNKYRWGGGAFQDGPLDVRWVSHHPAFQDSLERLRRREQIIADSAAAIPAPGQPGHHPDPAAPVRAAILDYYQKRDKAQTQATDQPGPPPGGKTSHRKKEQATSAATTYAQRELTQAETTLHQLGLAGLITPIDLLNLSTAPPKR